MLTSLLYIVVTIPTLVASASIPLSFPSTNQQPLWQKSKIKTRFRPITRPDLPSITTLFLEAFSPYPTWKYLMPDYEKHKAEVWECMFIQLEHALERFDNASADADGNAEREMGRVITVSRRDFDGESGASKDEDDRDADEDQEEVAVSVALWQILNRSSNHPSAKTSSDSSTLTFPFFFSPTANSDSSTRKTCTVPPSTNLTRAAHFNAHIQPMLEKYFYSAYPRQLYLNLLATHPSWDGNGFGARQVEWGERYSREVATVELDEEKRGVPVTLMATPVGWENLYEGMGFEGVKNVTYEMLDGEGELWWEVGRWGFDWEE